MKLNFKRIAAGALTLALTVSLCGCGDNGYLMTVDGMSIRNGVYLSFQQTAYNEAYNKIQEQNGTSDSSSSTSEIDVLAENVENKSASEWIKEQTIKEVRKFVAVQKLCNEYGITLTEDERRSSVHMGRGEYVRYVHNGLQHSRRILLVVWRGYRVDEGDQKGERAFR